MSATTQNYTLDDFISHNTAECAGCGGEIEDGWVVPKDSPVGRVMELCGEDIVCNECFQSHTSVYATGDSV